MSKTTQSVRMNDLRSREIADTMPIFSPPPPYFLTIHVLGEDNKMIARFLVFGHEGFRRKF